MNHPTFEQNILSFPKQLSPEPLSVEHLSVLGAARPDGVVILGIGGSALPGEIVEYARGELGLAAPVILWRDYGLPSSLPFRRPLYIVVSFSGNTAEPLSGFHALLKRRAARGRIAVVTSGPPTSGRTGGELLKTAGARSLPLVHFSADGLEPRQGTGFMFYGICEILRAAGLIKKSAPAFTHLRPASFRREGMRLARIAHKRLITIYTRTPERFIGYFWKIRCNENGKLPAFNNIFPEMSHNEIVGFEGKQFPAIAIFLEDTLSGKALSREVGIIKTLLTRYGVHVESVHLRGTTVLEKTWNAIMLADWFSYFLARGHGADPQEINVIHELKKAPKK